MVIKFNYDFFISRSSIDAAVGMRVRNVLEAAGLRVISQEDFGTSNFARKMEEALETSERMICIVSRAYQASEHCRSEYLNFLGDDTANFQQRLIGLRIEDYKPTGLLTNMACKDLFGVLEDWDAFRAVVLDAAGRKDYAASSGLAAVVERLPEARTKVQGLAQQNNHEMRVVRGLNSVLDGLALLGGGTLDVVRLAKFTERLDGFVREAAYRNLRVPEEEGPFSLSGLQELLSDFRRQVEQLHGDYPDGEIPNDWPTDTVKHYEPLSNLLSEIDRRKLLLGDIADEGKRREVALILHELESELCRTPLSLKQIDMIRARLEALDEDVFHDLLVDCQILPGRYADQLAPGSVFRDVRPGPELVVIPSGSFLMGSVEGHGDEDERPQHEVRINYLLAVGRFAVTFDEWDAYASREAGAHKPLDKGWGRGNRPVVNVSWNDAQDYGRWLSDQTEETYRLLSEAEWEYACRAGANTQFSFGDDKDLLTDHAWHSSNSNGQTHPVGLKLPNDFGLYDMHGNVWEWCEDAWHNGYDGAPEDGSAWDDDNDKNTERVLRGGSMLSDGPHFLRARFRFGGNQVNRIRYVGFRVARAFTIR